MVKQGVVPDDFNKPFFDAANEGRLVVQSVTNSDRLYFPPRPASEICPVASLKEALPFNLAAIMLDEDPGILMYSHLPGVPPDEVPVGAAVRVIFEETANGQKVPEWVLVE